MKAKTVVAIAAALLCGAAAAQDSTDFVKQVQERLSALGFYAGPVNGDFGFDTQAALAQFQLSRTLPASGQVDAETALALGVARDATDAGAASPENPDGKT